MACSVLKFWGIKQYALGLRGENFMNSFNNRELYGNVITYNRGINCPVNIWNDPPRVAKEMNFTP